MFSHSIFQTHIKRKCPCKGVSTKWPKSQEVLCMGKMKFWYSQFIPYHLPSLASTDSCAFHDSGVLVVVFHILVLFLAFFRRLSRPVRINPVALPVIHWRVRLKGFFGKRKAVLWLLWRTLRNLSCPDAFRLSAILSRLDAISAVAAL